MKWVWLNQFNTDYCEQVPITSVSEEEGHYAEFPDDPALKDFDRADRKFVAVARASRHNPIVCNATDTDWWKFRKALGRHRVQMEFLCPELMRNRGR